MRRKKVAWADINSVTDSEFLRETHHDRNKNSPIFFFFPQSELLRWANKRWGRSQACLMKFTSDDKLRVMGILLCDEELKDFIPDVTRAAKGGVRISV